MERYPEHRFACSSAQQYKWLEQVNNPFPTLLYFNIHIPPALPSTLRTRQSPNRRW